MPRSKPKRGSGKPAARSGGRMQTVGLFVTLAAVAVLLGSLAWGAWDHFRGPSAVAPSPPADTARTVAGRAPTERVRVEVLNATRTPGLARRATDVLRDRGFDVVQTGNASRGTSPESSVVYDRVGRIEVAREVGAALGISRVESRRDTGLVLEATVILGRDWQPPAAATP